MELQVLLDAPDQPRRSIQIARLGPVKDPRYGEFEITAENVEHWQRNLSALPGQRALIDFEHRSERKPRDSKAAGWITGVQLDGNKVMADTEWSDEGEDAVRNKRYLFLSPCYGPFRDEHGARHEDTLQSVALTNKPVLSSLPMLTLATEERVSEAIDTDPAARFYTRALDGELGDQVEALVLLDVSQSERDNAHAAGNSLPDKSYPINNSKQLRAAAVLAASGHGNVAAAKKLIRRRAKDLDVDVTTLPGFAPKSAAKSADSRRTMDKALLTALGLDEDSELVTALADVELDEDAGQKLLDAATELRTKADEQPPAPETKTLEQQARENGMEIVEADRLTKLERDATAGAAASIELKEQKFEHAFEAALNHEDGPKVTPAEKDDLKAFFQADPDRTLRMLEARQSVLPGKPHGAPAIELDLDSAEPHELAAAGIHPEGHQLHQALRKHMTEKGLPKSEFPKLLDQYMSGQLVLA